MRTYTIFLLISILSINAAHPQKAKNSIITQYAVSFPIGNSNDFIKNVSFRGFMLDYRYHVKPELAVGLSSGWLAFFEQKDFDTYTTSDETTSYSGTQYRYVNSLPVLLFTNYYLTPERTYSTFVGMGTGVTYNKINNRMGSHDVQSADWQFTIAPEAGIWFGYDFGVAGYLSARYNNNFKTGDLDNQSYLSLNVGLMYR